ncbi:MAG: hypothetical protein WCK51_06495 [Armatimonadota bacterium]
MKSVLVSLSLVTATIALAAGATEAGCRGRGWMMSNNNRKVRFEIEVKKVTREGRFEVGGSAKFRSEFRDGDHNVAVTVGFLKCARFAKGQNVAEFAGEATMYRSVDGKVVSDPKGYLFVVASDRRAPNATTGNRDLIRFKFVPREKGETIEVTGEVIDGDVVVYEKNL